jgi:hypothetical protein
VTVLVAEITLYKSLCNDEALFAPPALQFTNHSKPLDKSWTPRVRPLSFTNHLGIPENQVPHTTNHLESFNGRIKNKFFAQYQHGGRLPRIDVWILVLIMKVIPTFFTELADHDIQMEHYHKMRHAIPRVLEAGSHETTVHIHNPTKAINLISTQEVSIAYQIMDDISIDNNADDSDLDPDDDDELDEMLSLLARDFFPMCKIVW